MSIPTEKLKAIVAACEKATPGPLEKSRYGAVHGGPLCEYTNGSARPQVALFTIHDVISPEEREANGDLFVLAADPEYGMKALAERVMDLEAAIAEAPHAYTCDMRFAPCTPACEECTVACLHHPNAVDKKCDCWKSRIGEVKA
ncbi:MAG TPA: hypothetical protein VN633_18150 [Bryobacteraceae bacterium]|nr:hypothetical protein [Bryobacteraceae bacterium]